MAPRIRSHGGAWGTRQDSLLACEVEMPPGPCKGDAQSDAWRQGAERVSQGRRVDLPTTLRLADTLQGWVWGGWGGPARGPAGAPLQRGVLGAEGRERSRRNDQLCQGLQKRLVLEI